MFCVYRCKTSIYILYVNLFVLMYMKQGETVSAIGKGTIKNPISFDY